MSKAIKKIKASLLVNEKNIGGSISENEKYDVNEYAETVAENCLLTLGDFVNSADCDKSLNPKEVFNIKNLIKSKVVALIEAPYDPNNEVLNISFKRIENFKLKFTFTLHSK